MLKEEFEKLIGKEVDTETFDKFNEIYLCLPNKYDKFDFVEMLDISKIPESKASIERKKEQEKFRGEILQKINDLKSQNEIFKNCIKEKTNINYYKKEIEYNNYQIAQYKVLLGC